MYTINKDNNTTTDLLQSYGPVDGKEVNLLRVEIGGLLAVITFLRILKEQINIQQKCNIEIMLNSMEATKQSSYWIKHHQLFYDPTKKIPRPT